MKALKEFSVIAIFSILFMCLLLKACDREYDYQQAKYDQWKSDRIAERPYKSFNE